MEDEEQLVEPLPGFDAVDEMSEDALRAEAARRAFEAKYGEAEWASDYFDLMGQGWGWRKAAYIVWASQPKESRAPKTQDELAQELGLAGARTIRKWRAKNPAIDQAVYDFTALALLKARAEVFAALIAAASNPTPRAATDRKLFFQMSGDFKPETSVRVGELLPDDLAELSDKQLRAMAQGPQGDGEGE